jgi:hypothetical protein
MEKLNLNNVKNPDTLSEAQIDVLENSNLDSDKRLDVALLLTINDKLACQLGNFKILEGEDPDAISKIKQEVGGDFNDIKKLLEEAGLFYYVTRDLKEDNGIFGFSILAAKDKGVLKEVTEADNNADDKKFGMLMGYPQTSVEAYGTEDSFNWCTELPFDEVESLNKEGISPFIHFKPSRSNWENELSTVRERVEIIKKNFPKLFLEITKQEQ